MFGFYYNGFYLEHILFQLDQPFRGEKVLQKIDGNLICQFFVCLFCLFKSKCQLCNSYNYNHYKI